MKIKILSSFGLLLFGGLLTFTSCHKDTETTSDCATLPKTPVATTNSPVGPGMTVQLNVETIPGATYSWTGPNQFSSKQQNPSFAYDESRLGEYKVTATVNGCTSDYYTVYVTTDKVIASSYDPSKQVVSGSFAEKQTIELTASNITNAKYKWYKMNSAKDSVFIDSTQNVYIKDCSITKDSGLYKVYAFSPAGIVSQDTALVKVHIEDPIMSAGKNDSISAVVGDTLDLRIKNAKNNPGYKVRYKSVYDHLDTTVGYPGLTRIAERKMTGPYTVTASYHGYTTRPRTVSTDIKYSYRGCNVTSLFIKYGPLVSDTITLHFKQIDVGGKPQCWSLNSPFFRVTDAGGATVSAVSGDFSTINASFIPGQGKCPEGYHVSTRGDWNLLQQYYSPQQMSNLLNVQYNTANTASFWTSTELEGSPNQAWVAKFSKQSGVFLFETAVEDRLKGSYVSRCVRD